LTGEESLRENWNRKAEDWHRQIGVEGDRNRQLRLGPVARKWLGDTRGLCTLDAGCGTGWMAGMLAEMGSQVTAVDFSEEMVRVTERSMRERSLPVATRVDDCSSLVSCRDLEFDIVTSIYVLQDLPDLDGALSSFYRVLKPSGTCLLAFSHPCFGVPGGSSQEEGQTVYRWPHGYFSSERMTEVWLGTDHQTKEKFSFQDEFVYFHRPLHEYWKAFRRAGFVVLELEEPFPSGEERKAMPYPMMVYLKKP